MIRHRLEFHFAPANGLRRIIATCIDPPECRQTILVINERGQVPGPINHGGALHPIPDAIVDEWKEFRPNGKPKDGRVRFI
jgi:hypothetical protein